MPKIPHFSSGSVFDKFAYKDTINYEFYLKQGRPSYAYCVFILEQYRYHKKLTKKRQVNYTLFCYCCCLFDYLCYRKKQACNIAHGLALCNFCEPRIVAACISFIEMIGLSSEKARLHVTVANLILHTEECALHKEEVGKYHYVDTVLCAVQE